MAEVTPATACPTCFGSYYNVIYLGFPMKLCKDEDCSTLYGGWAFIFFMFGAMPNFMFYEDVSYFRALWIWLFKDWQK